MTLKEKAIDLVNKFMPLVTTWDCYNDEPRQDKFILKDAKQCALIVCDEFINNQKQLLNLATKGFLFEKDIEYWQEVKKEIEEL